MYGLLPQPQIEQVLRRGVHRTTCRFAALCKTHCAMRLQRSMGSASIAVQTVVAGQSKANSEKIRGQELVRLSRTAMQTFVEVDAFQAYHCMKSSSRVSYTKTVKRAHNQDLAGFSIEALQDLIARQTWLLILKRG